MKWDESDDVYLHLMKQEHQEQYMYDLVKSDMLREQYLKKQNSYLYRILNKAVDDISDSFSDNRQLFVNDFNKKIEGINSSLNTIENDIKDIKKEINKNHNKNLEIFQELFYFIGLENESLFEGLHDAITDNKN